MRPILILLALAGLCVSSLALRVHYDTGTEPCSINDHWDCGIVNHSSYALFLHVPVAAIGIAGYLLLGVLALARRRAAPFVTLDRAFVAGVAKTRYERDVVHLADWT